MGNINLAAELGVLDRIATEGNPAEALAFFRDRCAAPVRRGVRGSAGETVSRGLTLARRFAAGAFSEIAVSFVEICARLAREVPLARLAFLDGASKTAFRLAKAGNGEAVVRLYEGWVTCEKDLVKSAKLVREALPFLAPSNPISPGWRLVLAGTLAQARHQDKALTDALTAQTFQTITEIPDAEARASACVLEAIPERAWPGNPHYLSGFCAQGLAFLTEAQEPFASAFIRTLPAVLQEAPDDFSSMHELIFNNTLWDRNVPLATRVGLVKAIGTLDPDSVLAQGFVDIAVAPVKLHQMDADVAAAFLETAVASGRNSGSYAAHFMEEGLDALPQLAQVAPGRGRALALALGMLADPAWDPRGQVVARSWQELALVPPSAGLKTWSVFVPPGWCCRGAPIAVVGPCVGPLNSVEERLAALPLSDTARTHYADVVRTFYQLAGADPKTGERPIHPVQSRFRADGAALA